MGSTLSRTAYAARRLVQGGFIILGIVVANFLLLHLAPGDAVDVLAGEGRGGHAGIPRPLRRNFGLDQPLYVQLLVYVRNMLSLDLGYSFATTRRC